MQSHILPTEDEEAAQEFIADISNARRLSYTPAPVWREIQRVGKSVHVEINDKKGTRTLEAESRTGCSRLLRQLYGLRAERCRGRDNTGADGSKPMTLCVPISPTFTP